MNLNQINKKWIFFCLIVVAQFSLVFYTIYHYHSISNSETILKFRLQGYDPKDFFRGDYLRIRFKDNVIKTEQYVEDNQYYIHFKEDSTGCAIPDYFDNEQTENSIQAKVKYYSFDSTANISYPFNKVWMNQEDCKKAERIINKALRDNRKDAYALVAVKNGEGVLKDVEIEGIPLKKLVKDFDEEPLPLDPTEENTTDSQTESVSPFATPDTLPNETPQTEDLSN